jgi:hypothetical protein
MSTSTSTKLVGGAAAAAAIGLLITPVPSAHADYDCYKQGGYQFPGGEVVLHYPETDSHTNFRVVRGDTHVNTAAETFYQNGTILEGRITGDMEKGGNIIRLKVTRGGDMSPLILDGAIGPDGTPQGSFVTGNLDRQLWDSPTVFACIPGPPVEDPLPKPNGSNPVAAAATSATVGGSGADVFNIAHNDVPDPANGVQGMKIATLPAGAGVGLAGPCKDGWCRVNEASIPQGFGFVEQSELVFG